MGPRARGKGLTSDPAFLKEDRHAVDRRQRLAALPAPLGGTCHAQGRIVVDAGKDIEDRIVPLGTRQNRDHRLAGRGLVGTIELCEFSRDGAGEIIPPIVFDRPRRIILIKYSDLLNVFDCLR